MDVLDPARMAAWCVVPYDSRRRAPSERAAMLARLGLAGEVWDWREEHVPLFPAELDALAEHGLRLFGVWAPAVPAEDGGEGPVHPAVAGFVAECATRGLTPDLWACLEFGDPGPPPLLAPPEQAALADRYAEHLAPLAELAGEHGMRVALYNHLGWAGEPANQIAVVRALAARGLDNVGLVYQQHHGHRHLDDFAALLAIMAPHLLALGLNGMIPDQHWGGRKVHPYGRGPHDVELARAIVDSGWQGLVTVLGHTMDDAEDRLHDDLEGLAWVRTRLRGEGGELPPARVPDPAWPH